MKKVDVFEASRIGKLALRKTVGPLSGGTVVRITNANDAADQFTVAAYIQTAHSFHNKDGEQRVGQKTRQEVRVKVPIEDLVVRR